MTRVYIGVGSNIDRVRNVRVALDRLEQLFAPLMVSPVYESEAMGFEGDAFFNLVVGFDTQLSLQEVRLQLQAIERESGSTGNLPKFSARSLDLDLLTFGDFCGVACGVKLPRADITEYAYTLWPLSDIAPRELHPQLRISYGTLKQQFAKTQRLWSVSFLWGGRDISDMQKVG
ncbi:MAG TPA: 2-amino-4-hydroxy-6-hydroxymethyldihydropteridine diphosphokinase [Spongiibacteraceae bacterium]|nr:2-amino-4-hydroxy-6-hydroxymethyldihydropteridine diphosphokinase [Spongiibacteraceae bacterium]